MGTVGAIVVLLVLLISAAVTLVIILVTVPADEDEVSRTTWDYPDNIDNVEHSTYRSTYQPLTTVSRKLPPKFHFTTNRPVSGIDSPNIPTSTEPKEVLKNLPFYVTDLEALKNGTLHPEEKPSTNANFQPVATSHPFQFDGVHLLEDGKLNPDQTVNGYSKEVQIPSKPNIPTTKLNLLREIPLQKTSKIIGMAYYKGLLYIGNLQGTIQGLNPVTGEQVKEITLDEKTERLTVSSNGDIVILHDGQIRSFRDARNVYEIELTSTGKDITATDDRIIVLGRTKPDIAVLSNSLELIKNIPVNEKSQNACNFITANNDSYFISCEDVILQISKDGQDKKRIGKGGSFSLGITFDDKRRLLAVVRGKPRLRVFENGNEIRELFYGETPSIWSEALYEHGRLHVVDYLSNSLKTFQYPVDLL